MANVIDTIDCRGFRVFLTEKLWTQKILYARPWMLGWESLLLLALIKPNYIYKDADKSNRDAYYMIQINKKDQYIKIVVEFNTDNNGRIISAYPTDSIKKGESLIWPLSQS